MWMKFNVGELLSLKVNKIARVWSTISAQKKIKTPRNEWTALKALTEITPPLDGEIWREKEKGQSKHLFFVFFFFIS